MQLRYRIDLQDYREAQHLMAKQNIRWSERRAFQWTLLALGVAYAFALVLYAGSKPPGATQTRVFAFGFSPLILLMALGYLMRLICRHSVDRAYQRDSSLQREFTLDLADERILSEDSNGASSRLPWSH